jgi:hypothetical protein
VPIVGRGQERNSASSYAPTRFLVRLQRHRALFDITKREASQARVQRTPFCWPVRLILPQRSIYPRLLRTRCTKVRRARHTADVVIVAGRHLIVYARRARGSGVYVRIPAMRVLAFAAEGQASRPQRCSVANIRSNGSARLHQLHQRL